jgi:signal transduction histidine kinase
MDGARQRTTRASANAVERRSLWTLLVAFGVIAALFGVTNTIAMYRSQRIRSSAQTLVVDLMASVELVSRMARDIDRERLLVDAHIVEQRPEAMAHIERDIDETRTDFDAAAVTYRPIADQPGERAAWRDLCVDVRALEEPIAHALALSRANRDVEARRELAALDDRWREIDARVERLIAINRDEAARTSNQLDLLLRSTGRFLALVTLGGVAMVVFLGVSATRLVHRREAELARYSALLEARNRDLDAFAGRVAHDLRGPLTSIAFASARRSRSDDDATGAVLRRGVERMEALIDDLLSLSRVGAGPPGECDPASVAAKLVEELAPRLAQESVALKISVPTATVACSEGLLRQALANLIDNGIKYRRADVAAEVEVAGRAVGARYDLRIADNGIGMSPDEASQLFEPFFRARRSLQAPGTGLGLSIVKRVIEASAGAVGVESQLGRGTVFTISLPLVTRV